MAMSAETVTQTTPNVTDRDLITDIVTQGKPQTEQKQETDNGRDNRTTEKGDEKLEGIEHATGNLFTKLGKQVVAENGIDYDTAANTTAAADGTESPVDFAMVEGVPMPSTPLHTTGQESAVTKGELAIWGAAPRLKRRLVRNTGNRTGLNIITIDIVLILCEGTWPTRRQRRGNSSFDGCVRQGPMTDTLMNMMTMNKEVHRG